MARDRIRGGKPSDRSHGVLVPALVSAGLGLLLRILYLVSGRANPFWDHLGLDMAGYDRWARAVLAGHGLGEVPFTQAPLFPLLLSAAYRLLGPDPVRALWFQLLPGTAVVFLTAYAAGRWRGFAAAWVAGILVALYKPAIFYTGVLLPPAWVLFCAALALAATMRSVGAPGWSPARTVPLTPAPRHRGAFGLAGLAFGLLASGQPAALVAAVPALWLLYRRESAGLRRPRATAARGGAAADLRLWFVGGIALPLLLTLFYNGIGGGTWSAPAVNGGINLYIGNGPEANGGYVRPAGTREDRDLLGIAAAAAALGKKDGVNAARANSYWTGKALGFALSHPLRTIGLYIRKVLFFFGQYEIPQVESLPFERRYSWILRIPLPGMALLFALGLFGALLLWREDRTARWLAASAAALALGVSVFFVTARFRLPVVPFLAVLAGGGISRAASLLRPSPADRVADARGLRRGPILIPAAVALALGSLLCVNLTGIRAKASEGQYHFRLGVIAEKDQHPDEAMREYAQAISLDPTLGKAEVNWGTLMARGGNLEGARVHLERGVALDPLSAVGLVNLGQIDQLQGDPESALALFQRAIEVDPSSLSARESAALLLYERGKLDEARTNLEFIVRSAPAGSPPALRAGSLLRILKDRDSLAPAWTSCGALLRGDLRLAQGDAAGAAVLYREAAADSQAAEAARRMLATLPR